MKIVIIGGGPAGMLAAISAKKYNEQIDNSSTINNNISKRNNYNCTEKNEIILIEKNNQLGKKMRITGKGRCNITSSIDISEFIQNTPGNGRFLYSAFKNFDNKDILELLDIPTKVERGNRIFPVSDRASDVVQAIEKKLEGIKVYKNTIAEEILTENLKMSSNNNIKKVIGVKTNNGVIKADKVIIATGGMSYPTTGSNGDGYKMIKKLGHTITPIKPSLVALTAEKKSLEICKMLQGLSLKNVAIDVFENSKKVYSDFGEMLFAHFGISGPIVLSASAHLVRTKFIKPRIEIDLKPALTEEKLNERILRDFEKYKNKELKNSLDDLLPQKMIPVIIELSKISESKKVNSITKEERIRLIRIIKKLTIAIKGFRPIEEAIITAGGVCINEINSKTMESKLIEGLYFAGEIIDVDAYTGGFNLQIAYSTGYTAGKYAICMSNNGK